MGLTHLFAHSHVLFCRLGPGDTMIRKTLSLPSGVCGSLGTNSLALWLLGEPEENPLSHGATGRHANQKCLSGSELSPLQRL